MLTCYRDDVKNTIPLEYITTADFPNWLQQQEAKTKTWLDSVNFTAEAGSVQTIPAANGALERVLVICQDNEDFWSMAKAGESLPIGQYHLFTELNAKQAKHALMAWGLSQYCFNRYLPEAKPVNVIVLPSQYAEEVQAIVSATYRVRDLVNTPTEDMGPAQLAMIMENLADQFGAQFSQVVGDELLAQHFRAIHTVGRASHRAPRLLSMTWGQPGHRKLTLVGKGVCFDSGGLDLKAPRYMRQMKKDMGGSAHVIGLAQLIMQLKLPIHLQVLVPAVENSVAGNAYRPGDVITMRSGKTVEIGNTDAEGRLILADALDYAAEFEPELIIDFATLTGAARVAVGTEISAMFANDQDIANQILQASQDVADPVWQLPLHQPYRQLFTSPLADMDNSGSSSYAGAIVAALFLESFIKPGQPWVHFDLMAFNIGNRPGRPEGGEAMALRAVYAFLASAFLTKSENTSK